MNAKIQAALETLTGKLVAMGAKATAAKVNAKFEVSEAAGIRFAETLVEAQSDSISEALRAQAALCKTFLAEIAAEEVEAPAPVVEKAPAKEESYSDYEDFMSRQEQPYMSEKQWNEAKAARETATATEAKPIYTFNIDNMGMERENLAQPGTGRISLSHVAVGGTSIKVKEGLWLSISVEQIGGVYLLERGVFRKGVSAANYFYRVSDPTWSSHDPEGNEYDIEWQYQGEKQKDLLNRIQLEGMEKVDLGDGEIYFIYS